MRLKLGTLVNLISLGDYVAKAAFWVSTSLAAVVSGYIAFITPRLTEYHPWSILASSLLGAVLFAVTVAMIGLGYRAFSDAMLANTLAVTPKTINPLEDNFYRVRINLSDFISPFTMEYTGKTFTECDFIGPAVICFIKGAKLSNPQLIACDLITPSHGRLTTGLFFHDTHFVKCRFYKVMFLLPEPLGSQVDEDTKGDLNWIVPPASWHRRHADSIVGKVPPAD